MLLHFRQGIVEAQIPVFFRVTYPSVDLIVTDTNTTVAFAAGSKDYLYTEQQSVANAWGPLHLGIDQWLYWDLDNRTGYRTFGITIVEPIVASSMPSSPVMDQHWFDTTACEMKVWTGNVWAKKIRTFACKLAQGRVPVSMSANSPSFIGTQVGNTSDAYAGHIIYDATTNNAIKNANGQFVTTEDKLSTKTISLSQVKVASIIVEGEAQQNMAAHTIVVFSEFGKIVHADQFVAEQPIQFGIIESTAVVGQTVNVVTSGMVTSQAFDFSAIGVNALLYCNATGQLVSTPVVPNQTPVAVVVDRKTIQLGVALASSTDTIPVINLATDTVYGISRLSVPAEDSEDPIVVGDNDPRFDSYVRKTGDTMTGPLYLYGGPTQDLHAATKKYVDDSRTPAAGNQYEVQYNIGGQFAASNALRLAMPDESYNGMSLNVGSSDHISATITTSTWAGNLQIEGGGRQDSQPGSAVLQGGALYTTTSPAGGPGTIFGGHAMVTGGPASGEFGRAGDAWMQGGTGDWINGRSLIFGGTNYNTELGRSTANGGNVQIAGGAAQGVTSTHDGGGVSISGGRAEGSGTPGTVQIFTDETSRIAYDPTGAWLLGPTMNPGTTGQVLTSNGVGEAPTWNTVSGGGGLSDRIVDGIVMQRVVDTEDGNGTNTLTIGPAMVVESTKNVTTFFDTSVPAWVNVYTPNSASESGVSASVVRVSDGTITIGQTWTGSAQPLVVRHDDSGTVVWATTLNNVDGVNGQATGEGQTISYDASNDRVVCTVTYPDSNPTAIGLFVIEATTGVVNSAAVIDSCITAVTQAFTDGGSTITVCGVSTTSTAVVARIDQYTGAVYTITNIQMPSTGHSRAYASGMAYDYDAGDASLYVVGSWVADTNDGAFVAKLDIGLNLVWIKKVNNTLQSVVYSFGAVRVISGIIHVIGTYQDTSGANIEKGLCVLGINAQTQSIAFDRRYKIPDTMSNGTFYLATTAIDMTDLTSMYIAYVASDDTIGGSLVWGLIKTEVPSGNVIWAATTRPHGTYVDLGFGWEYAMGSISINQHTLAMTGWYKTSSGGH